MLDNLAKQSGGMYFREPEHKNLIEALKTRVLYQAVSMEIPLVEDKYVYLIMFLLILLAEWTVRRKMNLF